MLCSRRARPSLLLFQSIQTGGKGSQNTSCCSGVEELPKNGESLLFQSMCSGPSVHEICKLGRKFHLNICFRVYGPSAKPFSSRLCWLSPYSLYCCLNLCSKVHSKTIQCKCILATEISPQTLSPAFLRDCIQIARRKTAL